MSQMQKTLRISIEGNIGSGKSTLVRRLSSLANFDVVFEPVELWQNYKGHNALELFYKNTKRWSFLFEVISLMTLADVHTQPARAPIKVMERSIYCTRHCFIELMYQTKQMTDLEYQVLLDTFNRTIVNDSCHLDLIIYLRATPSTCLKRIQNRNRFEETSITIDYLQSLHEMHEAWLSTPSSTRPPVIIIDAEKTSDDVFNATDHEVQSFPYDQCRVYS